VWSAARRLRSIDGGQRSSPAQLLGRVHGASFERYSLGSMMSNWIANREWSVFSGPRSVVSGPSVEAIGDQSAFGAARQDKGLGEGLDRKDHLVAWSGSASRARLGPESEGAKRR
jgi:hypothetical protein